jgi:hypothetical protein
MHPAAHHVVHSVNENAGPVEPPALGRSLFGRLRHLLGKPTHRWYLREP